MEKCIIRTGITELAPNGEYIPSIVPMEMIRMVPSYPKPEHLTKEDVWGKFDTNTFQEIKKGMVASNEGSICPYFGDKVPNKSVTVVCDKKQMSEVCYWLEYHHGNYCIKRIKDLEDGKIAIRSKYMAGM